MYLHETGHHSPSGFPRLVVDLCGQFDDLARSVAPQVTCGLQLNGPRLYQQVSELLSYGGGSWSLWRQLIPVNSMDNPQWV